LSLHIVPYHFCDGTTSTVGEITGFVRVTQNAC
jgi:hypothetical protein